MNIELLKKLVKNEVVDMLKSKYEEITVDFDTNEITVTSPLKDNIEKTLKGHFVILDTGAKVEITDGKKIGRTIFIEKLFSSGERNLDVEKRVVFFNEMSEKLLSSAIILETHIIKNNDGVEQVREDALFTSESLLGKSAPKSLDYYISMDRQYEVGVEEPTNVDSVQSYHAALRLFDDTVLITRGVGEKTKTAQISYSSSNKKLKTDDPSYDKYFFNKKIHF